MRYPSLPSCRAMLPTRDETFWYAKRNTTDNICLFFIIISCYIYLILASKKMGSTGTLDVIYGLFVDMPSIIYCSSFILLPYTLPISAPQKMTKENEETDATLIYTNEICLTFICIPCRLLLSYMSCLSKSSHVLFSTALTRHMFCFQLL